MASADRPWARSFAGLLVTLFSTFTGFGAVVPVIPRLVVHRLHGSAFEVGAVFTASAVVALLFRPYGGRLAQRFGCRPVMMAGCAIATLTGVIYMLPAGLPGLYLARLVMGSGEALLFTAGSVWTVQLAPAERRGQIVGWYGLAMWSGLFAGPLLGEALFQVGSYPAVWAAVTTLPALALVTLTRMPASEALGSAVSRRLLPRGAVLPGLALGSGAFGYATIAGFGALTLSARGIGHGSVLLSVFSFGYVAVRLFAGRLPDRAGPVKVIVVSSCCEAAGLLLIVVAPAWLAAAAGALIAGGGFTLLYPSLAVITIGVTPEAERGAALGAIASFFDVAVGIAGFACGAIAEASLPATFVFAAVMALGAVVLAPLAAARQ